MSDLPVNDVGEFAKRGFAKRAFEAGRKAGLIEAARALDARHNEYFNLTDKGSWHKAAGVREASSIVRTLRIEGAKA